MRVTRQIRQGKIGNEDYDWSEWRFDLDGRSYSAELRLGSGAKIHDAPHAPAGDIEAIADRLMVEDGVRFVYYGEEKIRPPRRVEPRPLRAEEAALLRHLLAVEDDQLEPLRQQVEHALVTDDSFLPFRLDLTVPEGAAPPATAVYRNPTVEADSLRTDEYMVTARLWIDGDYLSSIEVDWYDKEPDLLPQPGELQPARLCGSPRP